MNDCNIWSKSMSVFNDDKSVNGAWSFCKGSTSVCVSGSGDFLLVSIGIEHSYRISEISINSANGTSSFVTFSLKPVKQYNLEFTLTELFV